jgi:arrestin-related trafficking adapter 3/6
MPANTDTADGRSSHSWINSSGGNVYYRPRLTNKASTARFPRPQFAPRRTRPHAIHIITYPPGYVPYDLRPRASRGALRNKTRAARKKQGKRDREQPQSQQSQQSQAHNNAPHQHCRSGPAQAETASASASSTSTSEKRLSRRLEKAAPIRPVLDKILGSISGSSLTSQRRLSFLQVSGSNAADTDTDTDANANTNSSNPATQVLQPPPNDLILPIAEFAEGEELERSISAEFAIAHAQADLAATATAESSNAESSPSPCCGQPIPTTFRSATAPVGSSLSRTLSNQALPLQRASSTSAALPTPTPRPRPLSTAARTANRNSLMSLKSSASSLVTEVPKPVAAGSGVSCSILLAEPNIFLSGFDHDGHAQRDGHSGTALLRGKLQINVSKNVKIKAIQLKLIGRARTEWPEGIPPLKQEVYEEQGLRTQVLTFFNAMYDGWETDYGNQCTYRIKDSMPSATSYLVVRPSLLSADSARSSDSRELKRLSLQNVQQRSFNKGESPVASATQAKGFKVFYPGTYDYSFELPIDHHQLETTKLQYGSVRWELHATVDRAGAFKPNLHGMKEVSVVRVPDQMSLEMTEPISISRQWEDQLHYDIIISGKSFPIGSKIPIAFKLTPLAKVQIHKLKVFLTESIEYWTNDRRVTRKDSGRKILLLEKSAGKPLDPAWASSDLRTVRGGELAPGRRQEAREMAARRRAYEASRRQAEPEPLPAPSENLLGDLDLGLESFWGSTEIEANVQMPTCEAMAKNKDLRLNPDCSWKNVNVYHWIKVRGRVHTLPAEFANH